MHSIECKLIEVKEAKTLQQMLHSFLHAQERTKEGHPSNLLVSFTYMFQKGACYCAQPFEI